MLVHVSHPYRCQPTDLLSLFCEAPHLHRRHHELGFRNLELKVCEFDGRSGRIEFYREVPAAGNVPRALKQFQQDWNRISQRERWHLDDAGVAHATYSIRIPGMPVSIDGGMKVTPNAQGCVNDIALEIKCSIPLIGRVAVKYLAEDARFKLEQEYQVILNLLGQQAA